jgi:hypothetical protein
MRAVDSKEAGFDLHLAKPPDIVSLDRALAGVRSSEADPKGHIPHPKSQRA